MNAWLNIRELSSVSEARRRARRCASRLRFNSHKVEHAAIVATELTQNILRHGGGGQFLVDAYGPPGFERLALVGVDEGPGITKLDTMLRDGRSSRGSAGTGLGAMLRLSDRLDIDTSKGGGTLMTAEFEPHQERKTDRSDHAALRLAYPGSPYCGDSVAICDYGNLRYFMLCDGLGHGRNAAIAADVARDAFVTHCKALPPEEMLARMAEDLDGTRGAVASVVRLDAATGTLDYAGLGNISTLVYSGKKVRRLPVRDGLLGGRRATPHTERLELEDDAVVVMHSDGVRTIRDLETRGALLHRSAPLIAARLLQSHLRGRDDASILVARRHEGGTL